jgi:hypothetical protein
MALANQYATADAPGGGGGTSWGDSWTLSEMLANTTSTVRRHIRHHSKNRAGGSSGLPSYKRGTHVGFTTNLVGAGGAVHEYVAYDNNDNPVVNPEDGPIIDFNGLTGVSQSLYLPQNSIGVLGLVLEDAFGVALQVGSSSTIERCIVQNSRGTSALWTGNTGRVAHCIVRDSTGQGIVSYEVLFNIIYGLVGTGISGSSAGAIIGNYIRSCSVGINGSGVGDYAQNTIDNCTTGLNLTSTQKGIITRMLITNCTTGIVAAGNTTLVAYMLNNLWNNGTDINPGTWIANNVGAAARNTSVDPKYGDIANNDFSISESSIMNVGELGINAHIGAWQGDIPGGGSLLAGLVGV